MKTILLATIVSLYAISSFAASGNLVSYKSGDDTVQGILYAPEGKDPFPALVVIHEYWGLNDWVKEQAAKLAGEGYVTLAIDLYRGKVATSPTKPTKSSAAFRKTELLAIFTLR